MVQKEIDEGFQRVLNTFKSKVESEYGLRVLETSVLCKNRFCVTFKTQPSDWVHLQKWLESQLFLYNGVKYSVSISDYIIEENIATISVLKKNLN